MNKNDTSLSIKQALKLASSMLLKVTQYPKKEALILLSYFLCKDEVWLFLHEDSKIKNSDGYFNLIKRRANEEPIEYITKKVSFYSEEFFIDYGALIPRPETELLVDEVIKLAKNFKKEINISEIGIGSGIISIMLAKNIKNSKITATDTSIKAIEIAKKNIEKFSFLDKIKVFNSSYLDCVEEKIDIIVSNPPYVANDYEVEKPLHYEPKEAIFAGEEGDEILKNIIHLAKKKKVKYLACEIGYNQKDSIIGLLDKLSFGEYYFYKDLSGFDRGFVVST